MARCQVAQRCEKIFSAMWSVEALDDDVTAADGAHRGTARPLVSAWTPPIGGPALAWHQGTEV